MNIIIEGPDGGGKSTLADTISNNLDWPVVHSTGPSYSDEAFNQKATAFLSRYNTIFDRHCIVSERIYGHIIRNRVRTNPDLERMFYVSSKVIIYVPGDPDMPAHVKKDHDTAEHITAITRAHYQICQAYDAWALQYANLIYRKGEPPHRIVRFLKGEIGR